MIVPNCLIDKWPSTRDKIKVMACRGSLAEPVSVVFKWFLQRSKNLYEVRMAWRVEAWFAHCRQRC